MNDLQTYQLMTEKEAAALLAVSVSKLQKDRVKGGGLKYISYGKCVRYRKSDIIEFIEMNTRNSTSDKRP